MSSNRLISKAGLYFVGNFASRILSIFFIPIYAYYVASEELGYFDYFQTILSIIVPVVFIAIWESILKKIIQEKDEIKIWKIINTTNTFIFTIILTILIIYVIGEHFKVYNSNVNHLVLLMFISYSIRQIWQYYSRALNENKTYVFAGVLGSIVYLFTTIIFIIVLKKGVTGLFWSYIISQTSMFLVIEKKIKLIKNYSLLDFDAKILIEMIKFSGPLVINLISVWLITSANKIIITNFLGVSINGLYSFANRFSIVITMFGTIISMTLIEEAYIHTDIKKYATSFSIIIQKLFKLYFSMILVALPIINILYNFLNKSEYIQSENYVIFLLLSSMLAAISNNFGSSFQVSNKTQYIFVTTLIGAGIAIVGSLTLIKSMGIFGVLLFQVIGNTAMMVSRAVFAYKLTGLAIDWKVIIKYLIYTIVTAIIINFDIMIVTLIIVLINTSIIYWLNKSEIFSIFASFKSYIKR